MVVVEISLERVNERLRVVRVGGEKQSTDSV